MSLLSNLSSHLFQAPALSSYAQPADAKTAGSNKSGTTALPAATALTSQDPVALSQQGSDLAAQTLAERANRLGSDTVDLAQSFMANFAQQLFGNAANGAKLSFDSASLSTQTGFASMAQHSQGPNGSSDLAAFSMSESSHFIGTGKITTADGQSYDFKIEVQYQAQIDAAATQGSSASTQGAPATQTGQTGQSASSSLPSAKLPDINFGGGLSDLFQLMGRQMQGTLSSASSSADSTGNGNGNGNGGSLGLRLLNLVNSTTPLDLSPAQQRAKALASAYGVAAGAAAGAAPATPTPNSAEPALAAA